jgi:hypothetical protein
MLAKVARSLFMIPLIAHAGIVCTLVHRRKRTGRNLLTLREKRGWRLFFSVSSLPAPDTAATFAQAPDMVFCLYDEVSHERP